VWIKGKDKPKLDSETEWVSGRNDEEAREKAAAKLGVDKS